MRITMIGCGYVGLVTGTCLAEAGHHVVCTDNDAERLATLQGGVAPIYEPHLDTLLAANVRANRLSFTCDSAAAVKSGDAIF
ncbi:MAG TPA: UDP-glucose 6-dehydrogenase, partial [Candidatus Dormibacteraeota bacterium]|nr:UDP-glucose 6-dehydrogenase [Candidatus Dormibacteraeota bacterium]